jgi:hypothetical protein
LSINISKNGGTMSLSNDSTIKLEEIEKRMHSLNKKVLSNLSTLNETTATVDSLSNQIENINGAVLNNENNISSLDDGLISLSNNMDEVNNNLSELNNQLLNLQEVVENTETFNFFDIQNFDYNKKGFGGVSWDRIHFLCEKSSLVKLKVTVNTHLYSTGSTYTSTLYLMLNSLPTGTAILSETTSFAGHKDYTFSFEYTFYPTQEHNFINFRLTSSSTNSDLCNLEIKSVNIEATGRNIVFLNRKSDFKVFISKDYYYITKNKTNGGYYLKVPTSNVNLNSTFTLIPNLIPAEVSSYTNKYFPFNYTYLPKIVFNSSTSKYEIDHSETAFVFCINTNNLVTSGFTNPANGTLLTSWSTRGWVYSLSHPSENGAAPRCLGFAYTASLTGAALAGMSISRESTTHTYLSLNGTAVTGNWVSNVMVFAKDWEDNPNQPFMSVATNEYGQSFFFPALASDYIVDLGKGYQVNAYLQPDNSVTIYLRWLNKVYKKTLIFNILTSKYELSENVVEYDNTSEILEGYSTDLFVCDVNGNWSYIPA